uniref:alpha/beta hydrolase n=1 Tax=Parerythrobacter lutipelagi TaxID=1964208 RepID=UPI0010F6D509|nr:alpha/beta hydrolase [Parerythrobacter lutipelagi]
MTKRRKRVLTAIGVVAVIGLVGFLVVQYAIARNGPAVLDTVDRLTAGARDTQMLEKHVFGAAPAQKLAVYGPIEPDSSRPVLIFSHGGSWRAGDPDDYGFVARTFVPEGFVVVLAGYRLNPEVEFPAMLEDTASVVAWTRQNIHRHGGDPDAIFIAGHSAGAYNAVMTALDSQWLAREGLQTEVLAGVIGLAGPYDFYPFDSDSTRASFSGAPDPGTTTQPVAFVRGDAPPMLLMTGEKDTTVKPRNSRVLARQLEAAGGRADLRLFSEMDHYDILVRTASPWSDRQIIDEVRDFALPIASSRQSGREASVPVQGKTR